MSKYILHDTVTLKSSAALPYLLKEWLIDILCHTLPFQTYQIDTNHIKSIFRN